jgi:hypothetical protein
VVHYSSTIIPPSPKLPPDNLQLSTSPLLQLHKRTSHISQLPPPSSSILHPRLLDPTLLLVRPRPPSASAPENCPSGGRQGTGTRVHGIAPRHSLRCVTSTATSSNVRTSAIHPLGKSNPSPVPLGTIADGEQCPAPPIRTSRLRGPSSSRSHHSIAGIGVETKSSIHRSGRRGALCSARNRRSQGPARLRVVRRVPWRRWKQDRRGAEQDIPCVVRTFQLGRRGHGCCHVPCAYPTVGNNSIYKNFARRTFGSCLTHCSVPSRAYLPKPRRILRQGLVTWVF